jgi:hypothetical protein
VAAGTEAVSAAAVDPARAREEARHILAGRRYRNAPVPRPLRGVLGWIGDRVSTITRWIGDRFSWLPNWAKPIVLYGAIVVACLVIAFIVVTTVKARERNRAARLGSDPHDRGCATADDPAALEAAAAAAEARGDLALAVRLRFRAGLLRLDRDARAITYRASIPTGEVRAELESPSFDGLADTFEGITYGGNAAEPDDTAEARREWPRVVDTARRR